MDSLLATATAAGADLAIANDPDADRLAVALPDGAGWRVLTGDEVGALIADRMLAVTSGPDRIVVSTVVCSSLVEAIAHAAGVRHQTTLTGFKWIIGSAYADVRYRPVLAYEESLGYACTSSVRDKDGISAALRFVELTEALAARGATPLVRLDELARRARPPRHEGLQRPLRRRGCRRSRRRCGRASASRAAHHAGGPIRAGLARLRRRR